MLVKGGARRSDGGEFGGACDSYSSFKEPAVGASLGRKVRKVRKGGSYLNPARDFIRLPGLEIFHGLRGCPAPVAGNRSRRATPARCPLDLNGTDIACPSDRCPMPVEPARHRVLFFIPTFIHRLSTARIYCASRNRARNFRNATWADRRRSRSHRKRPCVS